MANQNCPHCHGKGGYKIVFNSVGSNQATLYRTCTACQKTHVYKAWMKYHLTYDTFRVKSPKTGRKLSIPSGYWDRLPLYLRQQLLEWDTHRDQSIVLSIDDAELLAEIDKEYRVYPGKFSPYFRHDFSKIANEVS